MLTSIENFYLNVLRVVILVAATLAIVGFGVGLIKAEPAAVSYFVPAAAARGAAANPSLNDFTAEQKAAGAAVDATDSTSTPTADTDSDAMKSAVAHLASYNTNRMGGALDMSGVRTFLEAKHNAVSADDQDAYDHSLDALMGQLDHSTGATPLDVTQVGQLINWHLDKFNAAISARQAAIAEQRQEGLVGLGAAVTALLTFVLLVFCFLFVKIERNLRLVRTLETGPAGAPATR